MLSPKYIGHFDVLLTISSPTNDDTGGERTTTYSTAYSNVNAKEVKARGSETTEELQPINIEKRAWAIRKLDRTISPEYRVTVDGDNYFVTSVYNYGADRAHLVIEAEKRDA